MSTRSYFSISFDLILIGHEIGYDLYVNSSGLDSKQKFIKIFNRDDIFETTDLKRLRNNYPMIYVAEEDRETYLKSLVKISDVDVSEATSIIKNSAIEYLQNIFEGNKEITSEILSDTIRKSKVAVESMIDVLDDYNIDSLRGLIGQLSAHDFYTYDHSINVSMYSIMLLKAIKPDATKSELLHAGLGSLLHDLGKIKISTSILNSPNGLTEQEYQEIKKHPGYGIDLLLQGELDVDDDLDLESIGRVINEHHENVDGSGYPNKKKGSEIHLLAKICAIADFYDAITTKRSYSDVMTTSKAIMVMENTCDKKIDRVLFNIFKSHLNYGQLKANKDYVMDNSFDPTIPYAKLPVEEIEKLFSKKDFGKIKLTENIPKRKKKK
ncbi:MAG: HD domain-containing protein [Bacteriovoracaceae bacterium]|nr:HD domain-containing protein [Bacteriovoracaceae bacterium]